MGDYVRDLKALYAKYGLTGAMYGHLGEGCIHSRISFDLRHADGLRTYRAFLEEAGDLVARYGGTMSGEHGDGQQRAELLVKQYGPRLMQAMREFKAIWDPDWKMNPGKVVDAYRFDQNLKLGVDYNPWRPKVRFAYAQDGGDFAHATLRCVGVGKCRDPEPAQTMCPSYQVTREEEHTTRGRARLLFEMLRGEVITDGWQSREVADVPRAVPGVQGLHQRLPGRRGHAHLQGRVPPPPLPVVAAVAARAMPMRSASSTRSPGLWRGCRSSSTPPPRRRVSPRW